MSLASSTDETPERVIVIGASAGGVDALMRLAAALPGPPAAPMLVVLHIGTHDSVLPELLAQRCRIDVAHARHGEPLRAGTIRIAPPDRHMTVSERTLQLSAGPKENHARPAIDPLFRSAALAFGPGAVGVVLTGLLDDGTAGLQAIKALGGVAVVQDPRDAAEPSMPASALRHVEIDHCVALQDLPALLVALTSSAIEPGKETDMTTKPPNGIDHEQALSEGTGDFVAHLEAIGTPSSLTCPECHGGLWAVDGAEPPRYRCHTGHAFTERTLAHALTTDTDESLWNALRTLHERQMLARRMIEHLRQGRHPQTLAEEVGRLQDTVVRLQRQISALRALIAHPPPVSE
jgi:two-component system chemotaxis response regulator CheB